MSAFVSAAPWTGVGRPVGVNRGLPGRKRGMAAQRLRPCPARCPLPGCVCQPVDLPPTFSRCTPVATGGSPTSEHTRITDKSVLFHSSASIYSSFHPSTFVLGRYVRIHDRPSRQSAREQPPSTPTNELLSLATDTRGQAFPYDHIEQWLAATMADLGGEQAIASRIRSPHMNPSSARRLGLTVAARTNRIPWLVERKEVAFVGCLAKFVADPALAAALVATAAGPAGPRRLVGATQQEREWGVGLSIDDPGVEDPSAWRGENLLGVALERVRDVLLAQVAA
ncbi:hypothetical protein BU14_0330s0016 [Porphyra umbilicalis]|uniref:NADAR domain-containing protein n=1 Tax=Porphyra umbilicalis TaxID=2786 RepID=A0A1X6NYZ4_PORUM|nr:hypothetical protein BU14_0330s0016 [Porphyra umbilicalis]|eukprot:OSX73726.1 hypothetical protein BU14_0330s0016 [Porphyra umbilicalis]